MTIDEIERNIVFLKRILSSLKEESKSTEELIFKKYIELESLPKVKSFLQKNGIKTYRGTIYQPTDLSEIIQSQPKGVDENIIKLAHKIFKSNTKIINRLYN